MDKNVSKYTSFEKTYWGENGKRKGSPEFWACRVKPGRILFEVDGVSEQIAKEALYKASAKLPIKTKTIKRFA